jgi:hypothetical protein
MGKGKAGPPPPGSKAVVAGGGDWQKECAVNLNECRDSIGKEEPEEVRERGIEGDKRVESERKESTVVFMCFFSF